MHASNAASLRTWAGLFAYSLVISLGTALSLALLAVVVTGLVSG